MDTSDSWLTHDSEISLENRVQDLCEAFSVTIDIKWFPSPFWKESKMKVSLTSLFESETKTTNEKDGIHFAQEILAVTFNGEKKKMWHRVLTFENIISSVKAAMYSDDIQLLLTYVENKTKEYVYSSNRDRLFTAHPRHTSCHYVQTPGDKDLVSGTLEIIMEKVI